MVALNARNVIKWLPLCLFVMILLNCRPAFAKNCVLPSKKKITGGCLNSKVKITLAQEKFEAMLSFRRGMKVIPMALDIDFGGCNVHLETATLYNTLYIIQEDGEHAVFTNGIKIKGSLQSIEFYNFEDIELYTKQCSPTFKKKKDDKFSLLTKMGLDVADEVVYLEFKGKGVHFETSSEGDSDKADEAMVGALSLWAFLLLLFGILLILSSSIGFSIYWNVRRRSRSTVSDQSHMATTPSKPDEKKERPSSIVVSDSKSAIKSESIRVVKSKVEEAPKEEVKPKKKVTKRGKTRTRKVDDENMMGDANLVRVEDQNKSIQIQGF